MIDINLIRSFGTLFVFIAFIGLCIWAYSPRRKQDFSEAEMLPFDDDFHAPKQASTTRGSKLGDSSND